MKQESFKVVIDRIEGDVAVVVIYEDDRVKFNLPVKYLPEGARGGDHFQLTLKPDRSSREAEKKKAVDLLRELKGRKADEKQ